MKILIPQATKSGSIAVPPRSVFDYNYPDSLTRRGRVQMGGAVCPGWNQVSGKECNATR